MMTRDDTYYYRVEYELNERARRYLLDPDRKQISTLWCGDDDDERAGVSCCRSLDDLCDYFAGRQWTYCAGTRVIELEGIEADEADWDDDEGAVLIWPARIVRVLSLDEAGLLDCGEPINNG